jgi:polysaccharide biosynthesis protein PslH
MEILVVSTWWPFPPNNGSKIRLYYLLRALCATHRVTLVAFCPETETVAIEPGDALNNMRVVPVRADPFRHINALPPVKFVSPIPLMCWPSREMQRAVQQAAQSDHFEAVVAYQLPVAPYVLKLPLGPRVFDLDTAPGFQMKERYRRTRRTMARWRAWLSWQKAERYERALARQFQVVAVSPPLELSYLAKFAPCAELTPNGVDCRRNRPGLAKAEPNTLIYPGALTYNANYDAIRYFLAEIYPLLREQIPEISLTITGSTSGVDLSRLQLDSSVQLSGCVADIRPAVSAAGVCVVPIRQGGGTRLKILEAMALGTPVVSTTKGAEGLEVTDGEHIMLADDPLFFAERVRQILRDPAVRGHLVEKARAMVEARYDWEQIGQQFRSLIEGVVQDGTQHEPLHSW